MVDKAQLDRIMDGPDSVTRKLVAMRQDPQEGEILKPGVWYSNFSRVKADAERIGIPFFAFWTNGDRCAFCRRFTEHLLDPRFIKKMETSGSYFWLGGSMDDNPEDGYRGKGFTWACGTRQSVSYPLFSISFVEDGVVKHQFFGSGSDYDQGKAGDEGTIKTMNRIAAVFRGDQPAPLKPGDTPQAILDQIAKLVSPLVATQPAAPDLRIRINPAWDEAKRIRFLNALRETGGHCPCVEGRTPETACLCADFMRKAEPGTCRCGFYEKYTPTKEN